MIRGRPLTHQQVLNGQFNDHYPKVFYGELPEVGHMDNVIYNSTGLGAFMNTISMMEEQFLQSTGFMVEPISESLEDNTGVILFATPEGAYVVNVEPAIGGVV